MILQSIVDMPRLYAGRDKTGHPWTALFLPAAFGKDLAKRSERQRVSVLRGLIADLRASTSGEAK